jgi:hypothetical protein
MSELSSPLITLAVLDVEYADKQLLSKFKTSVHLTGLGRKIINVIGIAIA